jgi:excisionase family DNA binding protein
VFDARMDPNNTPTSAPDQLHRPRAVMDRFDMSDRMLDRLIDEGELDVVLIGTHRRITESSIQRYLERHRRP